MFLSSILSRIHPLLLFISSEPGQKKDTLLSVEPGLMIWTVVIFLILLYILKKFAWKPLLNSLYEREKSIADSVQRAEYLKQEAEKMFEENKKLLVMAGDESRKIIREGKELGEKLKSEIKDKTNEEANKMIQQAKAEIEREKLVALGELKDEIANLAIQAAGKIIDENLDKNKQKKIIRNFIKEIPKN